MRLTIDLPEALLEEARRVADAERSTLRSLLEAGLRQQLEERIEEGLPRRCDFCGRAEHEVVRLIIGQRALICNECIRISVEILKEDNQWNPG